MKKREPSYVYPEKSNGGNKENIMKYMNRSTNLVRPSTKNAEKFTMMAF
jgi:hypothetical protein